MKSIFQNPALEIINYPPWEKTGIEVTVLREDLVHPFITGNKYRKLKYNLIDFKNSGKKIILSFGGAFSNHLVAVAASSYENGFKSIGIIRGEDIDNDYISFMRSCGMTLHFISRSDYRLKTKGEFLIKLEKELIEKKLIQSLDELFILPEGGSNDAAVKGASEIMNDIPEETEFIACACGTGATISGISKTLQVHQKALGISVLKANDYFENEVIRFGGEIKKITFINDYHFGGYAKKDISLMNFCKNFTNISNIPVEPVYTGKLFFGIDDLIKKNYFSKGTRVTLIHTGGIFNFTRVYQKLNLSYSFIRNSINN
jgi:1-aminocyclopropane-1-carboxylate deaminase